MSRRVTIIDVAERAGVSRQTVSRAMNDLVGISAETRERVLAAATELNYRPSRFGRGLVEQGPITLGLVVEDLSNAYFAELGAAVVRACAPYGWNVVLADALHAPHPERVAGDLARRVDALVGYGVLTADIRGTGGMPVVQLDGRAAQLAEGGVIELARETAMAELAEHLVDAGARRPVVLDLAGGRGRTRSLALAASLRPLTGGADVPVREVDAREGHREILEQLLHERFDTIVAFNDELAVRLLRALRGLGVDVPGRVRLVGVDGLEIASLVTPELTTLSIDIETVAQQTVSLVVGMLDGSVPLSGAAAHRTVPYRLEVRASS
ncbi:MAG: LacI family DNA-binding transcriptional regulator [Brachybacterium sp.]|uniref:LacI family DNA-binding transcriptional regulator n=1 Tax=Brachybacterium sp. TaxID=1891286 RepID=UPI002651C8D8|nr:LacI family transcriptional regulator [Brachybacterium sp.]MDN6301803.1 LacI family transcriptional regulator [Brachybacterium sp.]MDN6328089.1 LacI family transcriptional regulator [Brachybacterium sp.]